MAAADCEYLELLDLQAGLKEGIEEIFPGKLWVRAEVSSVQVKSSGHCYLDLTQTEEGRVVAKARAVIWRGQYFALAAYFQAATGSALAAGMSILARVQVNYSELYGLTLVIDELEPQFTLGQAELERQRTIDTLKADGLLDAQKSLELCRLPYRLAVVSAPDAAGYGDFCRHLEENEYGFRFAVDLFPATMQGQSAPESVAMALDAVQSSVVHYDAVLLIRGGGSNFDLSCFDDYSLCFAIANCGIPVFTAIGHERDYHVADMVACDFVKTPTALADLFIGSLAAEENRLSLVFSKIRLALSARIGAIEAEVAALSARIAAADPRHILSRGFSLATDSQGVVLKSASSVTAGEKVSVRFSDGILDCTVDKVKKN